MDSCSQLNIQSAQIKWEICKIKIKSKSIDYGKVKSRERNNTLQQLEKELSSLYSIQQNDNTQTRMNELEFEISQLYDLRHKEHNLDQGNLPHILTLLPQLCIV